MAGDKEVVGTIIDKPFRFKHRQFTNEELNEWRSFQNVRTLKLNKNQIDYVCKLYANIFNKKKVITTSLKELILIIERLDKASEIK